MTEPQTETAAARAALQSMLFGYFPAQVLYVTARLALADHLADGPCTVARLAGDTGCDPGALLRLLRALVVIGVLGEPTKHTFTLTDKGQLLRAHHPVSMRNYALLFCGPQSWQSWGDLEYSVRTGKSAWERRYGPPFGEGHMDPEFSVVFNAAMAEGTKIAAPAVVAVGDFGRFGTVADLGGGSGILLAAILAAHPGARGILFDLPRAVDGADRVLADAGVTDRCEVVPGDFFAAVPGGADAYLLKSVIHDWDDDRAATILANCQAVMSPQATLLLVEPVTSVEQPTSFSVSYSDLNMLVCTSGRERTGAEFRDLLTRAGFAARRIVSCPPTGYSIIEGYPLG
jgi:hypothetical protein